MVEESPPKAGSASRGCLRRILMGGGGCLATLVLIVCLGLYFVPQAVRDFVGS